MRTFSRGRLARGVAYLVNGAFLWSVVLGAGVVPVAAQVPTRGAATQSVAVVPFQNKTKLRPETLGAEAADAVTVELRDRLLLDVLPKADVALQMRDLGMVAPLADGEMVRLAAELDVGLVVTGEVRGARVISGRDGRYAEVVMAVRLFDRVARANVNGALVSAVSPTSEASEETLIQKALQQAAFLAIQQMQSRPTVTAMVLWSRADTVFLNVGTRGGMRPGLRLVAVRGGERIGMAKVTEADAIGAYATSVEGPPLRTGDQMRAVYELPTGLAPEKVGVAQERRNRFESVALAAALFLGLGNYASRARRVDEGNTTAPGFNAANMANGAVFGFSGYLPSFHAGFPLSRDLQPVPAVVMQWDQYQSSEAQRILLYIVMRSGEIVDIAGVDQNELLDVVDVPGFWLVTLTIDPATGTVTEFVSEFDAWEPEDFDQDTLIPTDPTFAEFVQDHEDDAGITEEDNTLTIGWFTGNGDDIGAAAAGGAYEYQIVPYFLLQHFDGTWEIEGGEFSTFPNFVVATVPAGVFPTHEVFEGYTLGVYEDWATLPNPEIIDETNMATFFFYYPYGATEIVLQLTRYPNLFFTPPVLNVGIPVTAPGPRNVNSTFPIDLALVPGVGDLFIWRINARSIFDDHPPRTWPDDDPAERGFVHSNFAFFGLSAGASRAAMMHEERQAMEALRAARARVPRTATTDRLHRTQ